MFRLRPLKYSHYLKRFHELAVILLVDFRRVIARLFYHDSSINLKTPDTANNLTIYNPQIILPCAFFTPTSQSSQGWIQLFKISSTFELHYSNNAQHTRVWEQWTHFIYSRMHCIWPHMNYKFMFCSFYEVRSPFLLTLLCFCHL